MASVLIIHERKDVCLLLSPVIEDNGHSCVSLSSCDDAIEVLKSVAYDIVILDIDITENAAQAILDLAKAKSRPHILAITNGDNPEILEQAIRAGAWDVICAPFTHEELEQAINRCLFHRHAQREVNARNSIKREAILGTSPCLDHCLEHIAAAAHRNVSVLILGETGTGKELFAQAIHQNSPRTAQNFIVVDCTNIPQTLAESLLFGHERGSFTGAGESRDGLFKQADGGTIFLDEIGDLDFEVQKSLLRVLQERKFRPLSSKKEIISDFRLIAATNRNLEAMVKKGAFRKDLYHRLCTSVIHLPPLRDRKEDILPIANYHVRNICAEVECPEKEISYELHHALTLYDWPGNVRELINVLHATVQNGIGEYRLYPQHLPVNIRTKVLLKRSGRPITDGYLVESQKPACPVQGGRESDCPLSPSRSAAGATFRPMRMGVIQAQSAAGNAPDARAFSRHDSCAMDAPDSPNQIHRNGGLTDPLPQHKPGNGFAHIEGPYATHALTAHTIAESELLPLRTVRELAMKEVETAYLQRLIASSQGNFQRALTISGLSRARLYDLLNKHNMSLSGN